MLETLSYAPCSKCGKEDALFPDPAGYYRHSHRSDGAPLMCIRCGDSTRWLKAHPEEAA